MLQKYGLTSTIWTWKAPQSYRCTRWWNNSDSYKDSGLLHL